MKTERDGKGRRLPRWGRVLLALMLLGGLTFGGLLTAVLQGAYDHVDGDPKIMVILGCKVESWGPSRLLLDRLNEALDHLEDHPDMTVVVSGGQGPDEPTTEAAAMAEYLIENGVPAEQILVEDQSHNTVQNFQLSRKLLEQTGAELENGVLVVSNGFHLTRARMLARRTGFEDVSTLAAPTSHMTSRLKMYIREPMALVKSFLFDR